MHIGSVPIYDQSTVEGGLVTFKSILAMLEERLGMARSFTERLVHVPLKVDYPYWVSDPDFDLEHHGELPKESLTAMAPISVRSDSERADAGNHVSAMVVRLRTDIADDTERLSAIRDATKESKELTNAVGARLMTDYTEFIPAATAALASRLATRLAAKSTRPAMNCVISNVPGPQVPLYAASARLVDMYGFGPLVDGLALFIPVLSYCGGITIGVTSCREMQRIHATTHNPIVTLSC